MGRIEQKCTKSEKDEKKKTTDIKGNGLMYEANIKISICIFFIIVGPFCSTQLNTFFFFMRECTGTLFE